MQTSLHLLLIDTHESRRAAFIDLLLQNSSVREARMAASLENALEQLKGLAPDMLILSQDRICETSKEKLREFMRLAARPLLLISPECDFRSALCLAKAGVADILAGTPETLRPEDIVASIQDSLKTRQNAYRKDLLAKTFMNIGDSICVTDPQDKIVATNDCFCRTYGYDCEQALGLPIESLLPNLAPNIEEDSPEVYHTRADGSLFPVSVSWSKIPASNGETLFNVAVIRDISQQKRAEERLKSSLKEKEILLKEIHHRVKNNLQVISSLLNLQSSFLEDERIADVLRDSQNRVKSMALIHELLYRSGSLNKIDFQQYLRSLISHVLSSYRNVRDISIETDTEDMLFNVDAAIPCGLIVNELLSNAIKHAFPDGGPGTIRIEMHADTLDGAPAMSLTISDNGVGLPESINMDNARSLGLQLIKMLTQQIKGKLSAQSEGGVRCNIIFPA